MHYFLQTPEILSQLPELFFSLNLFTYAADFLAISLHRILFVIIHVIAQHFFILPEEILNRLFFFLGKVFRVAGDDEGIETGRRIEQGRTDTAGRQG